MVANVLTIGSALIADDLPNLEDISAVSETAAKPPFAPQLPSQRPGSHLGVRCLSDLRTGRSICAGGTRTQWDN